ncbi:hypothetical protein [Paracraurococcus ruber]|nr:hypothetical protein [Paracraurococcus ruber]
MARLVPGVPKQDVATAAEARRLRGGVTPGPGLTIRDLINGGRRAPGA